MSKFLEICDYFEITPSQFFNESSDAPMLLQKINDELTKLDDDDLVFILNCIHRMTKKEKKSSTPRIGSGLHK